MTFDRMLLFQPFRLKNVELKNRIVMLPMGASISDGAGYVTERLLDYIERRAEGGVGFIFVGAVIIDPTARIFPLDLCLHDDTYIPGFKKLAEAIHKHGAKAAVQIVHVGREASPKLSGTTPVAPSPIPTAMSRLADKALGEVPRELTIAEIKLIQEKYAQAAARVKEAGFDAVELTCAHRHLPEQFLLSNSNKRQDMYGGEIENRARFICEIVHHVREKVGEDFVISCRVPASEHPEGQYGRREIETVFRMLENAGADIFNITVAVSQRLVNILPPAFPPGSMVHLAEQVKKFTTVPIITGIRINEPLLAERVLREGKADLIGMGRPLIVDPDLPTKAYQGELEEIRMCIACNRGCAEKTYIGVPITCTLNVEVGRERELQIRPTEKPKKVLIAGGGPSGMEAARVAALRGHEVLLYEKAHELGGQLLLARIPPHKEVMDSAIKYLKHQIEKLGVSIELGREVDQELVNALSPDLVIIATGAIPIVPQIPGVNRGNVSMSNEVLLGKEVGKRVVIVGGGLVGVETAEFLADRDKEVTVVEMLEKIAMDMEPISRMFLKQRLSQKGVKTIVSTKIEEIKEDGVVVSQSGEYHTIPADSVVIAVGSNANRALEQVLKDQLPIYIVGDSVEPRNLLAAIHEGSLIARKI